MAPDEPELIEESVDEIRQATKRAAAMTRQLLAFSRKQVLQPRVLSLNAVFRGMEDMFRRLLGEETADGPPPTRIGCQWWDDCEPDGQVEIKVDGETAMGSWYLIDGKEVRQLTRKLGGPVKFMIHHEKNIRTEDGRYTPIMYDPIEVADGSPAELARATQAIASALEAVVSEAPEQWYTFKPMWPATVDETAELERRAAEAEASDV